jgi:hypothetical protein
LEVRKEEEEEEDDDDDNNDEKKEEEQEESPKISPPLSPLSFCSSPPPFLFSPSISLSHILPQLQRQQAQIPSVE